MSSKCSPISLDQCGIDQTMQQPIDGLLPHHIVIRVWADGDMLCSFHAFTRGAGIGGCQAPEFYHSVHATETADVFGGPESEKQWVSPEGITIGRPVHMVKECG